MTSGTTAGGARRVYVAGDDFLLAYEPAAAKDPVLSATLGGDVTGVHLSLDGRFVLVTRHVASTGTRLAVFDADTLRPIREGTMALCSSGPCGTSGLDPMALTIDGGQAVVSNPEEDLLDYVYLTPPRAVVLAASLERVVAGVPTEAFEKPQDQEKLLKDVEQITRFLELAEVLPDPAKQEMLANAMRELQTMIEKFDGCVASGSPDGNDVVTLCAEQAGLYQVAADLATMIRAEIPEEGCPPVP